MTGNTLSLNKLILLGFSILIYLQKGKALATNIQIGAVFGKGDEERMLENAFKYALDRMVHKDRLQSSINLKYLVENLNSFNTFDDTKKVCNLVKKNSLVLFGSLTGSLADYVKSLCYSLKIPLLTFRQDVSGETTMDTFFINLYPDSKEIGRAFNDLLLLLNWESFVIMYDGPESYQRVQLINYWKFKRSRISIQRVTNETILPYLQYFQSAGYYKIFADLSLDNTKLLLGVALLRGMMNSRYSFILANLDSHMLDFGDLMDAEASIHMFRLINYENQRVNLALKDISQYEQESNIKILTRTNIISHHVALILDAVLLYRQALNDLEENTSIQTPTNISCDKGEKWNDGATLLRYLNSAQVEGITGKITINRGQRKHFTLYVLSLTKASTTLAYTWSTIDHLRKNVLSKGITMKKPHDKILIVTSIIEPPYLMYKVGHEKLTGNDKFEGFCFDLLKNIATKVQFKYEIHLVRDGRYGSLERNNQWNGMIGELVQQKADLAVAPLTITKTRSQVVDFTKPYLNLGVGILIRKPQPKRPGLFAFMSPLSHSTWWGIIGAYVLVSLTIYVIARLSPYEWSSTHPANIATTSTHSEFSVSNSLWFTFGTLMHQRSDVTPKAISTRIAGGIWWLCTIIIIVAYASNLAAFLTVEHMAVPIKSAEDLSKQTKISYGTLEFGSTSVFLQTSTKETHKRMAEYMINSPSVLTKSNNEGIQRVLRGNYAYLMESPAIDYTIRQHCDLIKVGELLNDKSYGIATPINSPLSASLSLAILELRESGTIMNLYNKWWKKTKDCPDKDAEVADYSTLNLENFGGIFILLLIGLAVAVVVAVVEFVWFSIRNASLNKRSLCAEMGNGLRTVLRGHRATTSHQGHQHGLCCGFQSPVTGCCGANAQNESLQDTPEAASPKMCPQIDFRLSLEKVQN